MTIDTKACLVGVAGALVMSVYIRWLRRRERKRRRIELQKWRNELRDRELKAEQWWHE